MIDPKSKLMILSTGLVMGLSLAPVFEEGASYRTAENYPDRTPNFFQLTPLDIENPHGPHEDIHMYSERLTHPMMGTATIGATNFFTGAYGYLPRTDEYFPLINDGSDMFKPWKS